MKDPDTILQTNVWGEPQIIFPQIPTANRSARHDTTQLILSPYILIFLNGTLYENCCHILCILYIDTRLPVVNVQ
jgi:hypothetical protein